MFPLTATLAHLSVIQPHGTGSNSSCGYCESARRGRITYGASAVRLSCVDYQDLCDRGWRRSGTYLYRPNNAKTCCPNITIRLKAARFQATADQNKVLRRLNEHLAGVVHHHKGESGGAEKQAAPAFSAQAPHADASIVATLAALLDAAVAHAVSGAAKTAHPPPPAEIHPLKASVAASAPTIDGAAPTHTSGVAFPAAAALQPPKQRKGKAAGGGGGHGAPVALAGGNGGGGLKVGAGDLSLAPSFSVTTESLVSACSAQDALVASSINANSTAAGSKGAGGAGGSYSPSIGRTPAQMAAEIVEHVRAALLAAAAATTLSDGSNPLAGVRIGSAGAGNINIVIPQLEPQIGSSAASVVQASSSSDSSASGAAGGAPAVKRRRSMPGAGGGSNIPTSAGQNAAPKQAVAAADNAAATTAVMSASTLQSAAAGVSGALTHTWRVDTVPSAFDAESWRLYRKYQMVSGWVERVRDMRQAGGNGFGLNAQDLLECMWAMQSIKSQLVCAPYSHS